MEKKLNIAICSTAHQYDDARIFHRQALSLSKHFNVTVYSCAPFSEKIIHKNLKVIGLPGWKRKSDRIKNLFILLLKVMQANADVYIFHDTIGMLLIPIIKLFKGDKIIYDIHENFHGWIREKDWIPILFKNVVAEIYILLEKIVLKFTDMIWFAVADIGEHYTKMTKIKKMVVGNLPSLEQFRSFDKRKIAVKNQFVFVGSMDADRSITQIIRAFKEFCKKKSGYQLVLAGFFYSSEYEEKVKTLGSSLDCRPNIKILGRVPYNEALKLIAESKVGLSLHQPTYNYLRGMPLKLLEYIGMGTPVIASNFVNFRRIVEEADCGMCVNPNNISEIARAMHYIANNEKHRQKMAANGKCLIDEKYNWEKVSCEIISSIKELCNYS